MCFKVKTRFDKFPRTSTNDHESSYTLDIKMKQSSHVETVVLLSRKSASKTFIPVTISPKDMEQFRDKTAPVQKMGKELNVN